MLPLVVNNGISLINPIFPIGEHYVQKLKASQPIAIWPQYEPSGTISTELINGWDGTYTNVTLGQTGIGDGKTSALYVPASSSRNNIFSAAMAAAFSPTEGSMAIWLKVASSGSWTDGVARTAYVLAVDANNRVRIIKSSTNNLITVTYTAGGSVQGNNPSVGPSLNWFHIGITWNKAADRVRTYLNGTLFGSAGSLGTWVGSLASTTCVIGAATNTGTTPWDGYAAYASLWNREISNSEMTEIAISV